MTRPPQSLSFGSPRRGRSRLPLGAAALAILLAHSGLAAGRPLELPYRQAGLSDRQAAAHLLDRLAFGARPEEVDRVMETVLETWVEAQLRADLPDHELEGRLGELRGLRLSAREASETYPNPGMLLIEASRAGVIDRDAVARTLEGAEMEGGSAAERRDRAAARRELLAFARERGYRPLRELAGQLLTAKILRALASENQLAELLTDFWFNHFNVSVTDNESRVYVAAYERDAIRPFVLGDFRQMLEATAKHPAMLHYLDNARSVAEEGAPTTLEARLGDLRRFRGRGGGFGRAGGFGRGRGGDPRGGDPELRRLIEERRPRGLNENYARELLELHTLGVDGGYDQDDVVEVARAFTGWTTYPPGAMRAEVEERVRRARRLPGASFVFEESFIFRADAHDAGEKTILGVRHPAGRGVEDGLAVLDQLAAHPATARHLARKLAVRFVADEPPPELVDRLAARYLETGGDLREVMQALVTAPEFWSPEHRGAKIKSPFELAVSGLRALGAELDDARDTAGWIARMGQPLYAYQAPTGYPDEASAWVNTGALLQRMNFALALATRRLAGVRFDLLALNGGREPESMVAALETYVPLLLPERDPAAVVERLEPMVRDPELARKVADAAPATAGSDPYGDDPLAFLFPDRPSCRPPFFEPPRPPVDPDPSPLAHVVGVILGSPEFQRR